jgi:hypothetical protein
MELGINGPRNTKKPYKEKETHLPDNLGLNIAQKAQQITQEVEAQNPVQILLGPREQARVKWTPRMHPDSILGHPPIHRKLTKSSTSSQNMGLRSLARVRVRLLSRRSGPSRAWRCIEWSGGQF